MYLLQYCSIHLNLYFQFHFHFDLNFYLYLYPPDATPDCEVHEPLRKRHQLKREQTSDSQYVVAQLHEIVSLEIVLGS